mmetsp:Transcript_57637/g.95837  ORF Transcript_57637/g.95837 Transcript_57637/m.95837 type:complete len:112 (-) Transcript_57637:875-1210(-)
MHWLRMGLTLQIQDFRRTSMLGTMTTRNAGAKMTAGRNHGSLGRVAPPLVKPMRGHLAHLGREPESTVARANNTRNATASLTVRWIARGMIGKIGASALRRARGSGHGRGV